MKTKMTDKENTDKVVGHETLFDIDSTGMPIAASRKPLTQSDLNDKTVFWKMQYVELMKQKEILRKQVDNLKLMVKDKKEISEKLAAEQASSSQYQEEIKKLKAEVNRKRQEILQLKRNGRNSKPIQKHPNMNKVFKEKRLLASELEDLRKRFGSLLHRYSGIQCIIGHSNTITFLF